jgi:uncharacterized protein YjiS (DUF1127 family)
MKGRMTNAPPIGDRLLTLREAADVLRLNTRTVRALNAARSMAES